MTEAFRNTGIDERLLKAVDKAGFNEPTPVQEKMIPVLIEGHDVQASAETGSGKTAAFLLPLLHMMHQNPVSDSATRCLILLPTRELAQQVFKQCRDLSAFTTLQCELIIGGSSFRAQSALIRKNPEILISTPGRLLEHVQKNSADLSELEFLVLDEADRMLDMGFREEVMEIVNNCNEERQTVLLSATLNHSGIGKIAKEFLKTPIVIDLDGHRQTNSNIQQQVILTDDLKHKQNLLVYLLANETYEKALVFCNTRDQVDKLAAFLQTQNHKVQGLHGEMTQDERKAVMNRFRQGGIRILIATDLAARGLDVKGIDLVINFSLARSGDEHVHRIGRTGRAGELGLAISLITPQEWNRLCSIERYLGEEFARREIKSMVARFKGPARKKAGKRKNAKKDNKKADSADVKTKSRHRHKKNIGKRRSPSKSAEHNAGLKSSDDGFSPLKRNR